MNVLREKEKIRRIIALEAARQKFFNGIQTHQQAKNMALKKLFTAKTLKKLKAHHMPKDREVQSALEALIRFWEKEHAQKHLGKMRLSALWIMSKLKPFYPKLFGSVLTGFIHPQSDINIKVFEDRPQNILKLLDQWKWNYKELASYGQSHELLLKVELTAHYLITLEIYQGSGIKKAWKPHQKMLSYAQLKTLLAQQHPELWKDYAHRF